MLSAMGRELTGRKKNRQIALRVFVRCSAKLCVRWALLFHWFSKLRQIEPPFSRKFNADPCRLR